MTACRSLMANMRVDFSQFVKTNKLGVGLIVAAIATIAALGTIIPLHTSVLGNGALDKLLVSGLTATGLGLGAGAYLRLRSQKQAYESVKTDAVSVDSHDE